MITVKKQQLKIIRNTCVEEVRDVDEKRKKSLKYGNKLP